jgi:hypothetical protein
LGLTGAAAEGADAEEDWDCEDGLKGKFAGITTSSCTLKNPKPLVVPWHHAQV